MPIKCNDQRLSPLEASRDGLATTLRALEEAKSPHMLDADADDDQRRRRHGNIIGSLGASSLRCLSLSCMWTFSLLCCCSVFVCEPSVPRQHMRYVLNRSWVMSRITLNIKRECERKKVEKLRRAGGKFLISPSPLSQTSFHTRPTQQHNNTSRKKNCFHHSATAVAGGGEKRGRGVECDNIRLLLPRQGRNNTKEEVN